MSEYRYTVRGTTITATPAKDGKSYTVRIKADFPIEEGTRSLIAAELLLRSKRPRALPQLNARGGVCWFLDKQKVQQACQSVAGIITNVVISSR
ncbi:MAG: hypothetical protein J0H49_10760 [Acidobacteria bacterium]|nr:hypothetical protein [Acidobacteriota bacterium]